MPLGPRIMQLGLELINLTIPFYLIKILIGHTLYINSVPTEQAEFGFWRNHHFLSTNRPTLK